MWNEMCVCRGWGWGIISFPSPHHSGLLCVGCLLGGWGKTGKCVSIPLSPIHRPHKSPLMEIPEGFPEHRRPECGTHILIGRIDLVVCIWKAWLTFNVIDPR